ncbi:hypothetical protein E2C01_040151 [Portunus trituberculatus]|uniref:Uncharacterized protein n=1 Tax=Portunus trituberculatus TaxID=210409 RepID=A0A5B7FGL7_PORTR|nr:hypothetical protein [Portunus trituberculatus]
MMSFPRLRDSRDFSPYSSFAEWADKDKDVVVCTVESPDVEGPAIAGSARFSDLKKEDIEERPAVAGSAGVIGTTCLTGLKNEWMEDFSFS